jgi:sulfofructosephosphate aldolase
MTRTLPSLHRLSRPSGTFAMVALDQRESLRTMMAEHRSDPVTDERLVRFKMTAAHTLGEYASGLLIDRHYGYHRLVEEDVLPDGCGLILAADALDQPPGGPVEETDLDSEVDPAAAAAEGAAALKLLLLWRRDEHRSRRLRIAERFIAACRAAGLLSVLEGVVRPAPDEDAFDLNEAIVTAAGELGDLGPSLYKAQVPGLGRADDATTAEVCREITARLPVPWVVLSQGVELDAFPHAVELACRSGASGFLAGRAVWSDTVDADDPAQGLQERSVPRLRALADTVDRYARPWWEVTR